MKFILDYDFAAIIVMLTIIISFFRKKTINTIITKVFSILTLFNFLTLFFEIIASIAIGHSSSVNKFVLYLVKCCYFICSAGVATAFFNSICFSVESFKAKRDKYKIYTYIPYAIQLLLIITTPITHWVFSVEPGVNNYIYGPIYSLIPGLSFLYMVLSLFVCIKERDFLTRAQITGICCYFFISIFAVVLQAIIPSIMLINFCTTLSILIVYLSMENPSNYTDKEMGLFNRRAFLLVIAQKLASKTKFRIVGFQISGIKYLTNTIGFENKEFLMKKISDMLMIACNKNPLFRLSSSRFAVVLPEDVINQQQIVERIKLAFTESFRAGNIMLSLSVRLTTLLCPTNAPTVDDAIDIIERTLLKISDRESGTVVPADTSIFLKSSREHAIQHLLKNALKNNEFFVVYQPIYSIKNKKFSTAEALIRLNNKELGFIGPDEFIPIAEQNGLILEIGEFVFKSVCEFILSEKIWEKGIEYIHVNLSVIECMQEKLYQNLLAIMDSYNLPYKYIHLEVTETSAIASRDTLKDNMKKLLDNNIRFSLDDFGTGFSNMQTLIEYPFQSIKLDKSIIQASRNDFKAKTILTNVIKMVQKLDMDIIAEGVEESEQVELLEHMGCTHIQGYYFSKPLPKAEFLEFIK